MIHTYETGVSLPGWFRASRSSRTNRADRSGHTRREGQQSVFICVFIMSHLYKHEAVGHSTLSNLHYSSGSRGSKRSTRIQRSSRRRFTWTEGLSKHLLFKMQDWVHLYGQRELTWWLTLPPHRDNSLNFIPCEAGMEYNIRNFVFYECMITEN